MAKRVETSSRSKENSLLRKLAPMGLLTISVLVSLSAYSEKQRASIKERDGSSCQFPGEHDCGGKLIVHQIIPPKYAKRFDIDPDFAENGLTICTNAQKLIYPDSQVPPEEIPAVTKARSIKLNQRKPYWNTVFDRSMGAMAVKKTQQAKTEGWEFPIVKKRKKSE